MKKLGLFAFILSLFVGLFFSALFGFRPMGFKSGKSKGSGNIIREKRDVARFSKIEISKAVEVQALSNADSQNVEVETDDNLQKSVITKVEDDTLKISLDKNFSSRQRVKVFISVETLTSADVSGASVLSVENLDVTEFRAEISGTSSAILNGRVEKLEAEVSGASRLNAENLSSQIVTTDVSGASKALVNASQKLSAEASGASSISYKGSPQEISRDISGASSIKSIN